MKTTSLSPSLSLSLDQLRLHRGRCWSFFFALAPMNWIKRSILSSARILSNKTTRSVLAPATSQNHRKPPTCIKLWDCDRWDAPVPGPGWVARVPKTPDKGLSDPQSQPSRNARPEHQPSHVKQNVAIYHEWFTGPLNIYDI